MTRYNSSSNSRAIKTSRRYNSSIRVRTNSSRMTFKCRVTLKVKCTIRRKSRVKITSRDSKLSRYQTSRWARLMTRNGNRTSRTSKVKPKASPRRTWTSRDNSRGNSN